MAPEALTSALLPFGYSPREAAFVAAAALHSGYFLARQYSPKRGKAADTLCRKLAAFEHASSAVLGGGVRLYHLHAKPLYRALGQTDNRHRRERDQVRAKVMGLDYVLLHPQYRYLPTEQDKLAYFCDERGIAREALPTKVYTGKRQDRTLRFFVDKYPVRIESESNRVAFCYIDDGIFTPPGFATWLKQYSRLIEALGAAEIVYVGSSPAALATAEREFTKAFPSADDSLSGELRGYFHMRSEIEQRGPAGRSQQELDAFRRLSRRYAEGRFEQLYALWRDACAPARSGPQVTFSTFVLPFSYGFFGTAGVGGKR